MKFQKSPFPYIFALVVVIAVSVYTNITINKDIDKPIQESISYNAPNLEMPNSVEELTYLDNE